MNISGRGLPFRPAIQPRKQASCASTPFLKTGEFILPPQHKKGAHLAARPGFNISHLIRVNFRMEVLKAFKEPQPLLPAMSKVKTCISCGQGNTVFSHLPPHRARPAFLRTAPVEKPEKGFKTGMLLQDSRKWCTPEEEYTIPDAVSGKCTTSGVRRVPTSR